jgi:starch synthase
MRILFVTSECFPYVKTGGLGDVSAALPPALRALGLDVRLLLPGYPAVRAGLVGLAPVRDLAPLPGVDAARLLLGATADGVPAYVLDAPGLFDRRGNPYLGPDGRDWPDNHLRFGAFSRAASLIGLEGDGAGDGAGWRPQLLHGHDWQAGLTPAYVALASGMQPHRPATVTTIHNLAFQGLFPAATLTDLELPPESFSMYGLEFWGQVGFLKAGLYYADALTTVSPTYAREIQSAEFGFGLDGLLRGRAGALSGILNGIDGALWDPATDPALVRRYDVRRLPDRAKGRAMLRLELGLAASEAPLFGVVSRLTHQKGLDMVLELLPRLIDAGAQLAVLGTGAAELEHGFAEAARRHPGQVATRIAYDEDLSHRMVAGCDVILIPSRFEPCGLVQMYAQRYGSLPLVTRVGGLVDTVTDTGQETLADGTATGFIADEAGTAALARATERVLALWQRPDLWQGVQRAAMARDFRWGGPARRYADLYRSLIVA